MSVLLQSRALEVEQRRTATAFEREAYRVRLTKVLCCLLLGVCFWFSVPYEFPFVPELDVKTATANEAQAYQGSRARQLSVPIIFCIAAFMLWRLPKRGKIHGKLMAVAVMYIGWAIISVAWSADPAITRKRLVVFAINAFFAYAIARTLSMMEMALLGFSATGTVALIAFYVETIKLHELAPFNSDYRFMGVMTANYMAMNLVVCVFCGLTLLQKRPRWVAWLAPALTFAVALLALTRSRVSTFILIAMLAVMLSKITRDFFRPHVRALVLIGLLAVCVPALIYIVGKSGDAAAQTAFMMGRSDSENTSNLSNRAPLWSELMESVAKRPWIGIGYDAFWTPARVEFISADQGWAVPHAHNTYLDQWLSLGIAGALLYFATVWGAVIVAWRRYFRERTAINLLPAVLLTWLALEGIAESVPLDPYLPTLLAYACIAKMCMVEGSEAESDAWLSEDEIIGGLSPRTLERSPEELQSALAHSRRSAILLQQRGRP
jgi:exopolysaccharide production protein ExoQ